MKKISIVILAYNSLEETTRPCLESIYRSKNNVEFETIVVDNYSTDGTREYLLEVKNKFKNLNVILNEKNYGYAAGNNIGIKSTRSDYYILLNNDTIVTDFWLDKMVDFFEKHLDVGLVGPVSNSVGNEQRLFIKGLQEEHEILEFGNKWTGFSSGDYFFTEMLGFFCVGIRREVFDKIGLLDENFGLGMFEDDDFCLRSKKEGYKLACMEDIFILHKGSISFNKLGFKLNKLFIENQAKFERKHKMQWRTHNSVSTFVKLLKHYISLTDYTNVEKFKFKTENRLNALNELFPSDFDINLQYLYSKKYELDQIEETKLWVFLKLYLKFKNKFKRDGLKGLLSSVKVILKR